MWIEAVCEWSGIKAGWWSDVMWEIPAAATRVHCMCLGTELTLHACIFCMKNLFFSAVTSEICMKLILLSYFCFSVENFLFLFIIQLVVCYIVCISSLFKSKVGSFGIFTVFYAFLAYSLVRFLVLCLQERSDYCDEYICLSVCLSTHISQKPHSWISLNFLCLLTAVKAQYYFSVHS